VIGIGLVLIVGLFGLDALSVRRLAPVDRRRSIALATVRAAFVGGASALFCLWAFVRLRTATARLSEVRSGGDVVVGAGAAGRGAS
jgi:hypothetical protein